MTLAGDEARTFDSHAVVIDAVLARRHPIDGHPVNVYAEITHNVCLEYAAARTARG